MRGQRLRRRVDRERLPRGGLRAHEVDRVVSVFSGVNARHARVRLDVNGDDHAFKDESIDERLKPGRPRVTALPQRERPGCPGKSLADICAVVAHHRQALRQSVLLFLGERRGCGSHESSSYPATSNASARVNAP